MTWEQLFPTLNKTLPLQGWVDMTQHPARGSDCDDSQAVLHLISHPETIDSSVPGQLCGPHLASLPCFQPASVVEVGSVEAR